MKKLILFCALSIGLFSCSSDDDDDNQVSTAPISFKIDGNLVQFQGPVTVVGEAPNYEMQAMDTQGNYFAINFHVNEAPNMLTDVFVYDPNGNADYYEVGTFTTNASVNTPGQLVATFSGQVANNDDTDTAIHQITEGKINVTYTVASN